MLANLPDISRSDTVPAQSPLAWVGMEGIDLPILVTEPGYRRDVHARIDALVDLPSPEVKGIHMSRLYRLVDTLADGDPLTPEGLRVLLDQMVESHEDCGSGNARLRIGFDLLVSRSALVTEGLSGWKSYPVKIEASLVNGTFACQAEVRVEYSSTCPCSAALSRQLIEQNFLDTFGKEGTVAPSEVAAWLEKNASMATPHSQRSEAHVTVEIDSAATGFGLLVLIDEIEAAVGTPVQTAVKRADEQAFAALNGQNLMFVEDAARRIEDMLGDYRGAKVYVRHVESLHPHDAVAWASPS
ncbi:GTP cyclohydrolase FolE2 [Parasphingopyxis sp.]|uniref:GTP cyclohydrolase FolE2 n=1 Tax=Parasphingopyxis sp. TaxID=1920299 RepID=UPI00260DC316|nr:GTP cyclohydrolase FolE2 [Parasphingopyxis sp.]